MVEAAIDAPVSQRHVHPDLEHAGVDEDVVWPGVSQKVRHDSRVLDACPLHPSYRSLSAQVEFLACCTFQNIDVTICDVIWTTSIQSSFT